MKLIVGLGNPGKKYQNSRHNLGFMVVDELARTTDSKDAIKDRYSRMTGWQIADKFSAEINKLSPEVLLFKPQTFMNGSGQAVKKLSTYYQIPATNIWVIHDDVDINLGKLKIRMGGSGGGHHGVESIIESLGTDKFLRFRLGIGHPRERIDSDGYKAGGVKMKVENFVLRDFDINEKTELKHLIKRSLQVIKVALKDGPEKAMNQFNR